MNSPVEIHPIFAPLAGEMQDNLVQCFNKHIDVDAVRANLRGTLPGTMRPIIPFSSFPCAMTCLVTLTVPSSLYIGIIKKNLLLWKEASAILAGYLKSLENVHIVSFHSIQCPGNFLLREQLKKKRMYMFPKWERGMMRVVKNKYIDNNNIRHYTSFHDLPGSYRKFLNVSRMVKVYLSSYEYLLRKVLGKIIEKDTLIILVDDTVNTGLSFIFQKEVLHRLGIPYERILTLGVVNERGGWGTGNRV